MYRILKRILDLFISIIALIILLPVFIVVSIILKFTGEGEILYFQERIGCPNKYFNIWKFATMLKISPTIGTNEITIRDDYRVLKFGKILRKTKINELPQIINVIKGDMSIVGPRPTVKKHYEVYPENVRKKIYSIKPGVTGIGSIIFRDEEELISNSGMEPLKYYKEVIIPYKTKLEFWYLENRSLYVDIMIIFLTAWVILFKNSTIYYSIFKGLPKRDF